MFLALGVGAWASAIFHLVSHGFFKGLLFMGSGSVIHGAGGEQDMRFMGNLRAPMRWTYVTMVIGSLALAGIPIFSGFFSKDEILAETFNRGYLVFYLVGIIVAFMTAFYTFRMIFMTFWGEWRGPKAVWDHIHESAPTMVAPLVILAVPTDRSPASCSASRPRGASSTPGSRRSSTPPRRPHAGVLPGSIAAGEHHGFELFGLGGLLLLGRRVVAVAGVWLAYRWYVRAAGVAAAVRGAHPVRPRAGDVPRQREQVLRRRHLRARLRARRRPAQRTRCGGSTPRSSTAS